MEITEAAMTHAADALAASPETILNPPTSAFIMAFFTFAVVRTALLFFDSAGEWRKESYSIASSVIAGLVFVIIWQDYYSLFPIMAMLALHARADQYRQLLFEYEIVEAPEEEKLEEKHETKYAIIKREAYFYLRHPCAIGLMIVIGSVFVI